MPAYFKLHMEIQEKSRKLEEGPMKDLGDLIQWQKSQQRSTFQKLHTYDKADPTRQWGRIVFSVRGVETPGCTYGWGEIPTLISLSNGTHKSQFLAVWQINEHEKTKFIEDHTWAYPMMPLLEKGIINNKLKCPEGTETDQACL